MLKDTGTRERLLTHFGIGLTPRRRFDEDTEAGEVQRSTRIRIRARRQTSHGGSSERLPACPPSSSISLLIDRAQRIATRADSVEPIPWFPGGSGGCSHSFARGFAPFLPFSRPRLFHPLWSGMGRRTSTAARGALATTPRWYTNRPRLESRHSFGGTALEIIGDVLRFYSFARRDD